MSSPRRVALGEIVLTVFLIGKLRMKLSELVRSDTRLPDRVNLDSFVELPIYSAHLSLGGASIVVDPCDYESLCPPEEPWRPPGYVVPPPLLSQLAESGVRPEEVTHVVMTHFHHDHCNGATVARPETGTYAPAFPRARYYLGKADWEAPQVQEELENLPITRNSLGVLDRFRVLTLVNGPTEISPGVTILPAPGESPGHQVIRLVSGNSSLYCVGDLFHEPMDVSDPTIMAEWNDPEANFRSRQVLLAETSGGDSIVFAGHMSVGRILRGSAGYEWREE